MAKRNELKPIEAIDPLSNIAEIAFDMELQIQDAIGIVRTAHDRLGEFEEGDPLEALRMIWFRLEQIREGHALIAKNASRRRCVLSEKGEMS